MEKETMFCFSLHTLFVLFLCLFFDVMSLAPPPQVYPIQGFPDREICDVSTKLINEHLGRFSSSSRILQQVPRRSRRFHGNRTVVNTCFGWFLKLSCGLKPGWAEWQNGRINNVLLELNNTKRIKLNLARPHYWRLLLGKCGKTQRKENSDIKVGIILFFPLLKTRHTLDLKPETIIRQFYPHIPSLWFSSVTNVAELFR